MQTVAILNAGLGDLSIGFQLAGFNVIVAYEPDLKALSIHKANLDIPIYPELHENSIKDSLPDFDVLAAHLYFSKPSNKAKIGNLKSELSVNIILRILRSKRVKAFFFIVNKTAVRNEFFNYFESEIRNIGYTISFQAIDIAEAFGFPVKEHMNCIVGISQNYKNIFEFPFLQVSLKHVPEEYLQLNQPVNEWYTRINFNKLPLQFDDKHFFFCWEKGKYIGTDQIRWNYLRIPLVYDRYNVRKITHREVANLKGFPSDYIIIDKYKNWLYQKLMYAGNIVTIKSIADALRVSFSGYLWRNQGFYFEKLFEKYLVNLTTQEKDISFSKEECFNGRYFDFSILQNGRSLYFELKFFRERSVPETKLIEICRILSSHSKDEDIIVLVVMNEVSDTVKNNIHQKFGIFIWDIANLLWLFNEFPDIKNEFIALLDFTVDSIEAKQPEPFILDEDNLKREKDKSKWEVALARIEPGKAQFKEYETECIRILKYILGNFLTLWETQEQSNGGLYRFDMCCKIKNGANKDFFDTIMHYFGTKYIVFEFKNYNEKISQKEIYTTEKYLYEKALRKVAIIVSRCGADEHALQAARGSLRETGKLILCLSDNDLLKMIKIKEQGEQDPADFLGELLDDLLVHLEK